MSVTGASKAMSPLNHVKNNSTLAKTPSSSENLVQPSLPPIDYSMYNMKSPTVQCVKLNISNKNLYKTDLEQEKKTDVCIKKAGPVEKIELSASESERAGLPSTFDRVEAKNKISVSEDRRSSRAEPRKYVFKCGDDVFVQHKDGRYYLGTVRRTENNNERCLVKFGDNTEKWADASELRPLSSPGGSDTPAMCVVCKLSKEGHDDELVACDKCSRGYHLSCHSPPVVSIIKGSLWHCKRCIDQRFKAAAAENRALRKTEVIKFKPSQQLKYDLSSLHWDPQHRTNNEKTYCYCGTNGDWFAQMLQCARCKQWFHQHCILCLKYPVYSGDRFYVFVCSICNYGTEFLRRLEMKWVDLVHLVLYNLTVYHSIKYYDLDSIIIPYIAVNWHALQLSQKMSVTTQEQRRDLILSALSSNENRFKCGREIKKRTTIWGLRSRTPPPPPLPPTAPLPRGPLLDDTLSGRWGRLTFVVSEKCKSSNVSVEYQQMIVPADSNWLSLMMGKQFQNGSYSDVESHRSTPSPLFMSENSTGFPLTSKDYNKSFHSSNHICKDDAIESDCVSSEDVPLSERASPKRAKCKELKFYSVDYQGGGFVKKSIPFPKLALSRRQKVCNTLKQKDRREIDQINLDKNDRCRNRIKVRKLLKQFKVKQPTVGLHQIDGTILQKVHSFESLDHDNVSKDSSNTSGNSVKSGDETLLLPTPPTSMSAPPTPTNIMINSSSSNSCDISDYQIQQSYKAETANYDSDQDLTDFKEDKRMKHSTVTNVDSKKSKVKERSPKKKEKDDDGARDQINGFISKHDIRLTAINLEIPKLSTKNIIEHSKIMSLRQLKSDDIYSTFQNKLENDSSGDDTSSRGTLDSIIPHPANFSGKNNPFHNSNKGVVDLNKNCFSKKNNLSNKVFHKHNNSKNSMTNKSRRISLPINLNPVIQPKVKLTKRQLCEKDLIIGPNGEVKRRRYRRTKASTLMQVQSVNCDMQSNESLQNRKSLQNDKNYSSNDVTHRLPSTDNSTNVRCLRQRQEKNYCDRRRGSTSSNNANIPPITNVPSICSVNGVKSLNLSNQNNYNEHYNNPDDIQDLKSSVHSYFGAANRISAGEKFTLMGKRVTESGKLQYLIEWEGHSS